MSWAAFRNAIQQHNAAGVNPVDFVCVGDPPDLPPGTPDTAILLWAEREGRVLVSLDKNTLPGHLAAHLLAGHHSPGVFLVRRSSTIPQVLSQLVLVAHASDPLVRDRSVFCTEVKASPDRLAKRPAATPAP